MRRKSSGRRTRDGRGSTDDAGVTGAARQALREARPLRRRLPSTARPARVLIRSRKPWVFDRRRLFGWNVRLPLATTENSCVSSPRCSGERGYAGRMPRKPGGVLGTADPDPVVTSVADGPADPRPRALSEAAETIAPSDRGGCGPVRRLVSVSLPADASGRGRGRRFGPTARRNRRGPSFVPVVGLPDDGGVAGRGHGGPRLAGTRRPRGAATPHLRASCTVVDNSVASARVRGGDVR